MKILDVKIFDKTTDNINKVWEVLQKYPQLFEDREVGKKDLFIQKINAPGTICLELEDKCFIRISDIVIGRSAYIHIVRYGNILDFFNKCRIMIKVGFQLLDLQRLTALIPEFNEITCKYAEKIGFQREGIMRNSFLYQSKWCDIMIYSLLKEEV